MRNNQTTSSIDRQERQTKQNKMKIKLMQKKEKEKKRKMPACTNLGYLYVKIERNK